jgi:hypothetical protein
VHSPKVLKPEGHETKHSQGEDIDFCAF